jgi:peroxidase
LQSSGFLLSESDIGFGRSRQGLTCNTTNFWESGEGKTADYLNTAARLMANRDPAAFAQFSSNAKCLKRAESEITQQSKYRSFDGYGNNLKHPFWGRANTEFGRFAPKNYDDGISSVRRSVSGEELPSPRKIVVDVLEKAEKPQVYAEAQNILFIIDALYIVHDMGHQVPVEAVNNCEEISCCSRGNKKVLDPSVSHSACLPIPISKEDKFYGPAGVGCMNMVRSESVSSPTTIQTGEVLNQVTAFLDHSNIYGSSKSENKKIRTRVGGQIRLGKNNGLPVDVNGKRTKLSDRFTTVPLSALLPVMLSRNHNNLARGLAEQNPTWDDEKLFQEARRLNIALYQHNVLENAFLQTFGIGIYGTYDPTITPATTLEFSSATYRGFHTFMLPWMSLISKDNVTERIAMSDSFGRYDLIENRFDDVLRGALGDRMNFGDITDEVCFEFRLILKDN